MDAGVVAVAVVDVRVGVLVQSLHEVAPHRAAQASRTEQEHVVVQPLAMVEVAKQSALGALGRRMEAAIAAPQGATG